MSSREPMWYCHECHSEMRPLMVPDPHCASCNGTFVERIENPADDPREFQVAEGGHWDDGALPLGADAFLAGLRSILQAPIPPRTTATTSSTTSRPASPEARRSSSDGARSTSVPDQRTAGRNGQFTIRIERSNNPDGRTRTFVLGGSQPAGDDEIPRLSQFAPRNTDGTQQDRPNITGPMLAQYLLALMGPGRAGDPFSELLGGMFGPAGMPTGGPESGRWGDYVFNQEALDQIISQIMENSNAHQPVPASEEVLEKLPREVLEEGSPLLEKDCAVCKEQFKVETEDPDDLVVISLPCHHPFHENCIVPWLKTSATCPVCRYQLVPQPDSHAPGAGPSQSGPGGSGSPSGSRGNNGGGGGGGILQNVFNLFGAHGQQGNNSSSGDGQGHAQSTAQPSTSTSEGGRSEAPTNNNPDARHTPSTRREGDGDLNLPGSWGDEVD
ncbi:hypothetical protein BD413DRAFT_115422 [Trametes elegans]|nr:hypothetical protein BD413DRAFT_115422 [Trametes elegans]